MPRHLRYLEAALAASPTGWIAGTEKPAACDFAWGTSLRELRGGTYGFLKKELVGPEVTPKCVAFLDKFLALPAVAAYYAAHP